MRDRKQGDSPSGYDRDVYRDRNPARARARLERAGAARAIHTDPKGPMPEDLNERDLGVVRALIHASLRTCGESTPADFERARELGLMRGTTPTAAGLGVLRALGAS